MARKCTMTHTVTAIGTVFVVLGVILLVIWPTIFTSIRNHELALTPTSRSYSLWKVIPIPIYMEYYLFNWTNPHEINDHSKKPIVEQLGPYVFREHREKIIEGWFNDNKTVTYKQNRTWFFEPDLSNGTLNDLVTTLNVPAITAAYSLRDVSWAIKFLLDAYFIGARTKYFVTKSAREFLFEGYEDGILDLSKFKPGSAPFDKFGWMYARNGSADYDGVYNMKTDVENLGILAEWNYENNTKFYDSPCGDVSGSAGELFPPSVEKSSIALFTADICRTLELNYKEEVTVSGISGLRFWGDDNMFANKSTVPDNWCFCGSDGDTCFPNGIINVTTCKWGAPAFISFPHFYYADDSLKSAVIGMDPQEHLHQFYIDLEPETGIPLQVSAGFQINILLQPDTHYALLSKMPRIFFPMLWFRQRAHIDDVIGPQVKLMLLVSRIGTIFGYIFLSLGVSLLVIIGIIYITLKRREDDALYLNTFLSPLRPQRAEPHLPQRPHSPIQDQPLRN